MNAIVNTKLVLEDGIIFDGVLLHENGKIVALGRADEVEIPEGADIYDAEGLYTAPGFVDIHCHGSPEGLFCDEPLKCAEFFITHGTTTVLPTFYSSMTLEEILAGAERVKEQSKIGVGKIMNGLYMEGPFMAPFGSDQKYIRWTGDIKKEEYLPLIDAICGFARVWAIDPARKGVPELMADITERDPKAIFTMGHSRASFDDCFKLRHFNLKLQTHHSDSGKHPGSAQGTVGAGCDEYTLYNPEIYAELICDQNGVHVQPGLVKMLLRTKGVERVILITDHMTRSGDFTNNEADGIKYGPDLNYDYEGHLSGSHLTMENACRNLMTHTGYGLCHAIRCATLNPARMLGLDSEIGSLDVGKLANLIIIDDAVNIKRVILEGECVVG